MALRVRRRRAKLERYRLVDYLGLPDSAITRQVYGALRDQLLATFSDRLELMPWLWQHEPGVPDWLRNEPEPGDPRRLKYGWPLECSGAASFLDPDAYARAKADCDAFEAAELARATLMRGRRAWLAAHAFPTAEENRA
jgi:hypothetical protein